MLLRLRSEALGRRDLPGRWADSARVGVLIATLITVACGADGPVVPTPPATPAPPASPPAPFTLDGRVVATLSDDGVGGARVSGTLLEAWTDGDGRFSFQGQPVPGTLPITAQHPGFLPRVTRLAWPHSRSDATIDLIRNAAPFDLTFYRQLVRNDFDEPGMLRSLRRWTSAPSWYLTTSTSDTGRPVAESELARVEADIRASVPAWTGGMFSASIFERGENPPTQQGWIVVRFEDEPGSHPTVSDYCGYATVAGNPGIVMIVRRCIGGRTTVHEVGHAMGFWHVDSWAHVMGAGTRVSNPSAFPTAAEQYHARIAYTREPGNSDPDTDAFGSRPLGVADDTVVIACAR